MVQAFRQDKNNDVIKDMRLRGLDPAATYEVTDLDEGVQSTVSGADLMQKGLHIKIAEVPGAAILVYKRVR
jgi:alpha-galactosidase